MATAKPATVIGSQALQIPELTIYLRQTDPTLDLPLSAAYGGLDNRRYNNGDFLVHDGTAFQVLSITNAGDILQIDTSKPTGVKWSSDLVTALNSMEYFNSQKPVLQNQIDNLNDQSLSIGIALTSMILDKQQLQNNITSLTLYVKGQETDITDITTSLISLNTSIQDTIITINNLQSGLDAINIRINNVNTGYTNNIGSITTLSNIISQSQTNLQNQQLTATGGINKMINGDFQIWQRGTAFSTGINITNYLTADHWYHSIGHNGQLTSSQVLVTLPDSTVVNGIQLNVTGNSSAFSFGQFIEDVRSLVGTMTISFFIKAASNTTLTFSVVQSFGVGGSANVTVVSTNINVTTSITNYVNTFTFPSLTGKTIGTGSSIKILLTGSTWSNVQICRVQLQQGSTNLTFEEKPYNLDLKLCQRYYETGMSQYAGYIDSNQTGTVSSQFSVVKYNIPTVTVTAVSQSQFTTTVSTGLVNQQSITTTRVKTNTTSFGSFVNSWIAESEIF